MAAHYNKRAYTDNKAIEVTYDTNTGKVTYYAMKLPGMCGVALIHTAKFYPKEETNLGRKALYKSFNRYLLATKGDFELRRAKLMMTDHDEGDIAAFCRQTGWEEDTKINNPKTNRMISVFTKTKTPSTVETY